ncbi:MAG: hypothetical protein RIQ81_866 [Pseudomonadota bacterium]
MATTQDAFKTTERSELSQTEDALLRMALRSRLNLQEASWKQLATCARRISVPQGDSVFVPGNRPTRAFMIGHGAIRVWRRDAIDGELTSQFFSVGSFASPWAEFSGDQPLQHYWTALTDLSGWVFDLQKLQQLAGENHELQAVLLILANDYVGSLHRRMDAVSRRNATEKLECLYKSHRDLVGVVSQAALASYLGVTRETLNRINSKRMKEKAGQISL